ncbi:hypothetical protein COLO4_37185 [Corchorus olitorius]|uniref:Uncharacterized protein n=1 Tax=Corchorus olitorius TaxID=93759 RepID=A0A1R3G303_9ROSI|nr:hypothetical protein COLO4_37185 [Corchorus olitorius]
MTFPLESWLPYFEEEKVGAANVPFRKKVSFKRNRESQLYTKSPNLTNFVGDFPLLNHY